MSWLKCHGLIIMGNGFIGWILDDFVRNNDFEINWFNWCVGCENMKLWKNLARNLNRMVLNLKMMKFHFSPSNLDIYILVLELWENAN